MVCSFPEKLAVEISCTTALGARGGASGCDLWNFSKDRRRRGDEAATARPQSNHGSGKGIGDAGRSAGQEDREKDGQAGSRALIAQLKPSRWGISARRAAARCAFALAWEHHRCHAFARGPGGLTAAYNSSHIALTCSLTDPGYRYAGYFPYFHS